MSHVQFPFKKTNKQVYQKPASVLTDDVLYWKKLGSPVLVKEFGAIDYLDFSPVEPYYFAATCSVRIQVYNPITKLVTKNISRFQQAAYGATFRPDGRLIVSGGEEGIVKLFDVQSKTPLRIFSGHKAPVHRVFFTKNQDRVLSLSDDKSACVWDIASEQKINTFSEHNDYIRAGATSPVSPDIVLSGGYDNLLKLYDCRSSETILTVNHGSPVESTLFLPSGGIFISAGGTEIKVWDIFNGGRLLANISQHHKTVTMLRLASNNSRLLSSSLDRHVKIYDVSTFNVVHSIDFPNAVISLAISENDETLVAGMVDGIISIRKRERKSISENVKQQKVRYKFTPDHLSTPITVDDIYEKKNNAYEIKSDKLLRQMEFTKALTLAIESRQARKSPEVAIALLQELLRRRVLHIAMAGLQEKQIKPLLYFFCLNLGIPRFSRTLVDSINVFIDVFENQVKFFSEQNAIWYNFLQNHVKEEVEICKEICELEGAISMLLANSEVNNVPGETIGLRTDIAPSVKAMKDFVVDV